MASGGIHRVSDYHILVFNYTGALSLRRNRFHGRQRWYKAWRQLSHRNSCYGLRGLSLSAIRTSVAKESALILRMMCPR